jgi:hypothetical protein
VNLKRSALRRHSENNPQRDNWIIILRSGVFPRWLGIFFVVSTVALLAANEQTPTVLLAIPYGLAMVVAGYYMVAGGGRLTAAPAGSTS